MKPIRLFALFLLISITACKKDISNPISTQAPTSFSQAFDEFWNNMDVSYLYWDIDTTNWDRVYSQYKPLFGSLQLGNAADERRSVGYFRAMTDGLIDHHFSIAFTDVFIRDSMVDPAIDQLFSKPGFRQPYPFLTMDTRYLDAGYLTGTDNTTTPNEPLTVLSGTIHGNILFFSCSVFSLLASYQAGNTRTLPVFNYFFNKLQNPAGLKAVVLDFRDNPGGNVTDLSFLVGRMIGSPLSFGNTRYKSGNGRLDYTPWVAATVLPQTGAQALPIPIIILVDRYSASMAEITTMALRVLPNCQVVGETTFGATGPFASNSLYDDGPFVLPGFMSVTTSSTEFKYIDGKSYEGKGFTPDHVVPFNASAIALTDDPQMDTVLSLIH